MEAQLSIFAGWESESIVGIAPLFSVTVDGKETLYFLGSIEISDYLDFICKPEHKEEFLGKLLDMFANNNLIREIMLVNIPEGSSTLRFLKELSGISGIRLDVEKAYHTPVIPLPGDWETYLSGIDKKQRHEIRRKLRRAEENTEKVEWLITASRYALDDEVDALFRLMEMDKQKKNFLTRQMQDQMRSIIHWAFDEGILQLSFLQINGENAAAYLCFDYDDQILVYNSGFDISFSEYSPGWVHLSYLIRHAIERGKKHFDFMRGNETYKYRFGAVDGFVMRAILSKS